MRRRWVVHQEILKGFPAEQVRFFGTSSGGGLALSLCMYIKHEKIDTPYPSKLVLQSPWLQVPPSESQKAEMEKCIKVDVMIPPGFFDEIAPVLATGDEAYLLSPILFDMTGFPPIDIFYGTREVVNYPPLRRWRVLKRGLVRERRLCFFSLPQPG